MGCPYEPYIAQTPGELNDELGWMMLNAPTFRNRTGYVPERRIDTVVDRLNKGLDALVPNLEVERYAAIRAISDRTRVLFEADPGRTTAVRKPAVRSFMK